MNYNTQRERIFEYLKSNKRATGMDLLRNCGVLCYTKRISELRSILPDYGYTIIDQYVKVYSRIAKRYVSVKEYTLTRIKKKK